MEKIAHKIEEKERTADVQLKEKVPFSKMLLSDHVRKGINQAGFVYPTKIQANAIPLGKSGIDLLVQSKSGTGKTLIFSVILLEAYRNDIREPQSLILAPTREIAVQIEVILNQIGKYCQVFKAVSLIGGLDITEDRKKVQGAKAIVGTPGRVLHLIKNDVLNTSKIKLLILDEADKLMNDAFRQDIEKIAKSLSSKKQVIACSATFCDDLDKELVKYMRNPLLISTEKRATLLIGIKQFVYEIPEEVNSILEMNVKTAALNKIFSKIPFKQCLAFAGSQSRAESYRNLLEKNDWPCEMISGAQDQKLRLEIFKKFREFKTRILISTDLMSRGIDSEYVNLVVNIEVPENGPTYLHRIGRAGRFGSHGIAITFLCSKKDKQKFSQILNDIGNDMGVLKFPTGDIPDLWNFSNLNGEQKTFGLFERTYSEEQIEKKDENGEKLRNYYVNDLENLKVQTDSLSSSSQKQNSVNATTLDDASSLAVDSDIHLDAPNVSSRHYLPEKKVPSKSKRSKSKERKKKSEYVVEIDMNQACPSQKTQKKSTSSKQKSEKLKQNHEKAEENLHLEDESDIGNSSGGDTRTIIDFKSLVVDKEKAAPKTNSNDIFADYETFKEKPSENGSKSKSENKEKLFNSFSNNIFDEYDSFKEDQTSNTNNVEHTAKVSIVSSSTSNQSESVPHNSANQDNDKSIISIDLPKGPNPSPRELKPETTRDISNFGTDDNQGDLNKLQIQNLPSFNLPPRNNHPELDTSNDDDNDYISTATSSTSSTRTSGFDEKTTSLGSSGIITSTEYSNSEDSYQRTSNDDDNDSDDDDDEYFETSEESEDDSSSSTDSKDQYSLGESEVDEEEIEREEEEEEEVKSNLNKTSPTPAAAENITDSYDNDDSNYRYQQAYQLWTNMYWNQLTQIRDYTKFSSYVKEQHANDSN